MDIQKVILGIDKDYMVRIRRRLHMYPETGFDLPKTLKLVREELDNMGISYTEKYGKSSIVATINKHKTNFTIAIRADMDALPVNEINEVEYKSRNEGKMHACGHDAHTAALLGTIKALSAVKDQINCRLVFVFQPSEEGMASGAKLMVEDGIMNDIDCIIACHVGNDMNVGTAGFISGPAMAQNNAFTIELFGKSGHAALPHTAVDTIAIGVKIYSDIQFLMTREVNPSETCTLNVGAFNGGNTNNVIADYCKLVCTLRTYSSEIADYVMKRVTQLVKNTAEEVGGRGEVIHDKFTPSVKNDKELNENLVESARRILGMENVIILNKPRVDSEDFAFYQTKKPGVFFRVGSRNDEKGFVNMPHRNNWDIDEDSMITAVKVFSQFVFDNMNR